MTRSDLLRDLLDNGRRHDRSRLQAHAAELDLPMADILVVAGHPVPGHLLPPERDRSVLRAFAYRVTYCGHPQLAALREFVDALPVTSPSSASRPARDPATSDPFPAVLRGLMDNRGFGVRELPFVGLSQSTVRGMLGGAWRRLPQLQAMAGPLGWWVSDLATIAGERVRPLDHGPILCRHVGAVFLAATRCGTEQLADAAREADRLSARQEHGAWQPVSYGVDVCPEATAIPDVSDPE